MEGKETVINRVWAEEVGDLLTSVNPAMARGAMAWWGGQSGREDLFGEVPQEKSRKLLQINRSMVNFARQ